MKRTRLHLFASRLHKWLALFAGLQIILWFASGAYMSFMPIEEVRGEHLVDRQAAQPLPRNTDLSGLAGAIARYPDTRSVELLSANGKSFALLHLGHDKVVRVDPVSGIALAPLDGKRAADIVLAAWKGNKPSVRETTLLKSEPGDFRGDLPVWQVQFADQENTRAYVSPDSGKILAVRTDTWRTFDLMWGLHIMDWKTRENINSPWLFGFAVAALILALAGLTLLVLRWRKMRW
ncbi:PepSY domain-containing protein [Sphingorhabdus contaminans]|uniref:PepSY domain-containing protein n=1 Tax=Sphingorhabdus contaminans TaxID=1343899 RepID=UPI003D275305